MQALTHLNQILDSFHHSADTRRVFGEAISQGDRTIIPVARVAVGFGTGFGVGKEMEARRGSGGGAGGGLLARPVGVIEVSPSGTRFVPARSQRHWLWFGAGMLVGALIVRQRLKQMRAKKTQGLEAAEAASAG